MTSSLIKPSLSQIVTSGLTSHHSIAAYTRAIKRFEAWRGSKPFIKATAQHYRMHLLSEGYGASTINLSLSAIRALARELGDNGVLDYQIAQGIINVKGVRTSGVKTGNWLSLKQAQELLQLPLQNNPRDPASLRDLAVLSVLIGAGLRRAECAALQIKHIQERDGRPLLLDITGKRNKTRTVPIAQWVNDNITKWIAVGLPDNYIFHGFYKGGRIRPYPISPQGIHNIVTYYSNLMEGISFTPHDLRRTFAQLAYKGGSPVKQISLSLGHNSIKTTEIYLGISQSFTDAPSDNLGIHVV